MTAQNDADDLADLAVLEFATTVAPERFAVGDIAGVVIPARAPMYRACRRLAAAGKLVPHYGPTGQRVTRYSLARRSLAEEARNIFPPATGTADSDIAFTNPSSVWAAGADVRDPLVAVLKRQEVEPKPWWRGRLVRALRFIVGPPPGAFRE